MSKTFTWKEKFQYRFDNILAKGTSAIIGLLAAVSSVMIVIFAAIYTFLGGGTAEGFEKMTFIQSLWHSLMRTFDAGNVDGDTGWAFRIVGLFITLGGIFIMSALIFQAAL